MALYQCLVVMSSILVVNGFSYGAPTNSCITLAVDHNRAPRQTAKLPYIITVLNPTYERNVPVKRKQNKRSLKSCCDTRGVIYEGIAIMS